MKTPIRVIDISTVLAGPSVGMFFAELGADVIKIEHPKYKDVTRSWKLPTENSDSSISAYFSSINYKKSYKSLDLKDLENKKEFLDLIKSADILISNFKKGDDLKFGIQDEILFKINPRLIHGKITGYGTESDRVAYDLILQAESGFMSMNGTEDSGPVKMPVALIDVLAAHHLKEGILYALYQRETSGIGKTISISLYDAAISSLVNQASNYLMSNHTPQRIGSLHPNIAPYGELFTTSDEAVITFAIGSDIQFQKLCAYLHINELSDLYPNNQERVKNRTQIEELLKEKIHVLNSTKLLEELKALNIPVGKVRDLREVFSDESAKKLIRTEEIDGVLTSRVASKLFK